MSASITWTDAEGTSSLATFAGIPNRFNAWTPDYLPIGPSVVGLGTGQTYNFPFRNDLTVALEISPLVGGDLEKALRLKMHLMSGGQVSVFTTNFMYAAFETCILAPGTTPELSFTDAQMMEYTFSVVLKAGTGLAVTTGGRISSFYPGFVPNLKLWLRADNPTLIATKADDDYVGGWYDDSGFGYDAVQATGGAQPRYKTNIVNGKPVIRFDGSDDVMNTPDIMTATASPGTVMFWVMKRNTIGGANDKFFWSFRNNSQASGTLFVGVLEHAVGFPNAVRWNVNPGSSSEPISTGTADTFTVYALAFASASSVTPYVNGVAGTAFAVHGDISSTNQVRLGNVGSVGSNAAAYDMAEMIWYEGILSTANRNAVIGYLGSKYGITIP